jgi:hypothetical protein
MKPKKVNFKLLKASKIGFLGFFVLIQFFALADASHAICCRCNAPGSSDNICLIDQGISSCSDLVTNNSNNTALSGVTCDKTPLTSGCAPISGNESGVCNRGPMMAVVYTATSTLSSAPQLLPIVTPTLNVQIPGLKFSKVSVDGELIDFPWLAQYLAILYKYTIGASIVAAAIMLVYGGFKYILSTTAPSVSGAKETITDAIAGLLLVLAAYLIISTISPTAISLKSFSLLKVDRSDYDAPSLKLIEKETKVAKGQLPPDPPPPPSPGESPVDKSAPPTIETAPTQPAPINNEEAPPVEPSPAGGVPQEPSNGCDTNGKAPPPLIMDFDWAPKDYFNYYAVKGSKLMESNIPGRLKGKTMQRILVDGRIRNCPGSYPVIFFFHGNKGYLSLETKIGALTSYYNIMTKGFLWGNDKKDFPPFIVVFPASSGESESLWPGMKLSDLRDAALETLQKNPETKGVKFSSYSLAAHSGTGCNKNFWGNPAALNLPIDTIIYSDTCFGLFDAHQQPKKLVGIVSVMDNTPYDTFAETHGMVKSGQKCRKKYRGPVALCYQNPNKEYYLFYHMNEKEPNRGRNHGWPIGLGLIFALENLGFGTK